MKFPASPRALFLLAALVTSAALGADASPPAAKPDPWQPVRLLIGKWEGDVQGEPGVGKAAREYAFILNHRFVHVVNRSVYPPQAKNPKGDQHEDIGYLSYDKAAKKFVLRQFHSEGFVNHYVMDSVSADGRTLVFVTAAIENIPPGWRGRETCQIVSDDEFIETFALAEPGKDFVTYSETRFRRRK